MNPHSISLIKQAVSLPALVGEYTAMKQSGPQWLISCPWHKESNPSCRVYQDHVFCFVWWKHGSCLDIVMAFEGVRLSEALRILADRTGISLDGPRPTRIQMQYDRETQAFAEWWWKMQCYALALRVSAYAKAACLGLTHPVYAQDAGLLWRQVAGLDPQGRRRLCLSASTAAEREEWKNRMAWDKETTGMLVEIMGVTA